MKTRLINTPKYLLLIDKEAEIKIGQYVPGYDGYSGKIIDVLKVTNLEQFHTCELIVLAYYPLTKEAKELDLPILPDPIKERSIDSFAAELAEKKFPLPDREYYDSWQRRNGFIEGYKAAQSKQFNLEEVIKIITEESYGAGSINRDEYKTRILLKIQSLSTQQLLPKDFILGEGTTIEEQIKNGHYTW